MRENVGKQKNQHTLLHFITQMNQCVYTLCVCVGGEGGGGGGVKP